MKPRFTDAAILAEIKSCEMRLANLLRLQGLRRDCRWLSDVQAKTKAPIPFFDIVLDQVCRHFRVEPLAVLGPGRPDELVWPRHVLFWILRQLGLSSATIGAKANRGHGAVLHGEINCQNRMDAYPQFKTLVETIFAAVKEQIGTSEGTIAEAKVKEQL